MIKNTIILIFIIAIVLSFAGPASAFGILVRAPGSVGGTLKLKYTDYVAADYRHGIQKMIIGARPGSIYGVEGYGILSATADAPQYTFDAIETSEVFYYIMPLGCSADKVKASIIDPTYGIAELIIFSTKPSDEITQLIKSQLRQLASDLFSYSIMPCLYQIPKNFNYWKRYTQKKRWLNEADWFFRRCHIKLDLSQNWKPEKQNGLAVINIFECRNPGELRQKLLACGADTVETTGWRFASWAFESYCKPGNCFIAIKCTKTTLPVVYIEFPSPDFVIPLKHLSDENAENVDLRLITTSPFEVRNYNIDYNGNNIKYINDKINNKSNFFRDLWFLNRYYRYRIRFVRYENFNFNYDTINLYKSPDNEMINNVYNFFHGDTPENIIYSSLNIGSRRYKFTEDLTFIPPNSEYFKKIKWYNDFLSNRMQIVLLFTLVSFFASLISLSIAGYVTYNDWARHIRLSILGLISPLLIFFALINEYWGQKGTEIISIIVSCLWLSFILYVVYLNGLVLFTALALQVYIMFKPNFIFCFSSVIILIYHVVFAIIT